MTRGGKRTGSGRPKKEPTVVVRIPESKHLLVKQCLIGGDRIKLPLYSSSVSAGFPSPADDYIESLLDLNEYLIKNSAATFLVRAKGESMLHAGISSGDILIVDKSITPTHGKIVIAAIDGELTVKRLYQKEGVIKLQPDNPDYNDIDINAFSDSVIWGVVTSVIHKV
jgi:DNA polymerase V